MMGEYVIPLVLGGGRVDLIGNVIGRSFLEQQDYAFGSALALLVMAMLSALIALYLCGSRRFEVNISAACCAPGSRRAVLVAAPRSCCWPSSPACSAAT